MKKITALVLALTMICSLFAMAGYAEEKKEIATVTPGVLTFPTRKIIAYCERRMSRGDRR